MPYVYLIQPVELIGTKRYKIGMSSLNNLNRMKSYKNGTRYLFICEKTNALEVERKLIFAFNLKYKHRIRNLSRINKIIKIKFHKCSNNYNSCSQNDNITQEM